MRIDYEKKIISFIKTKISKNQKIDKNTLFSKINEFDSLNFVKLIIYLNKFSVNVSSDKLSKIKKIKDLTKVCINNE